jgi:hypothetical protein
MEPEGAFRIIKKIFHSTGLMITKYLGDGDSKAYAKARSSFDWDIEKLECTNHVAKRMGSRLRKCKLENKDVKLAVFGGKRKGLGGMHGLTDNAINKIQQFYSWIILNNTGDVDKMRRYIMAMYNHISSTDLEPKHDECHPTICKYLIAKSNNEAYSHDDRQHFHIAPSVMEHVKHIFEDLAKPELLKKCVHGKTQNANECFNSVIWNFLPKNGFANRGLAEFATYLAVCIYNEGYTSVLQVLDSLGCPVGEAMATQCEAEDSRRAYKKKRSQPMARKRRSGGAQDDQYQPGLCE